nr:ABC transporter substrate-binding protein [uncultured Desulfobacter sp.]
MTTMMIKLIRNGLVSYVWAILVIILVIGMLTSGCDRTKPKTFRVGVVCGADLFFPVIHGIKSQMTELGFKEDENIIYDVLTFNDDAEGEYNAAKKLVADHVDVIVTMPTQPSVMAHKAINGTEIPLVFSYAGIEGTGLVESVPHPGKNATGVRFPGPEQICKRLEILHEIRPEAKRIWIGYDKNYPTITPSLAALRPLASSLGITLIDVPVTTFNALAKDLEERAQKAGPGMDAMILMPDTLNHSTPGWNLINSFAEKHGLPLGGSFYYTVEQGALYGTGNEMPDVGRLTAPLIAKVLKGTPAGSIPVVTPEQVLVINLRVAGKLGITLPDGVLNMASKIIQ